MVGWSRLSAVVGPKDLTFDCRVTRCWQGVGRNLYKVKCLFIMVSRCKDILCLFIVRILLFFLLAP